MMLADSPVQAAFERKPALLWGIRAARKAGLGKEFLSAGRIVGDAL